MERKVEGKEKAGKRREDEEEEIRLEREMWKWILEQVVDTRSEVRKIREEFDGIKKERAEEKKRREEEENRVDGRGEKRREEKGEETEKREKGEGIKGGYGRGTGGTDSAEAEGSTPSAMEGSVRGRKAPEKEGNGEKEEGKSGGERTEKDRRKEMERREREVRKNKIVLKGVKKEVGKKGERAAIEWVEKVAGKKGVTGRVKEGVEGSGVWVVEVRDKEAKERILAEKEMAGRLTGVWTDRDRTREEKKKEWLGRYRIGEERRRGRRAIMEGEKIKGEEKTWAWDEDREEWREVKE